MANTEFGINDPDYQNYIVNNPHRVEDNSRLVDLAGLIRNGEATAGERIEFDHELAKHDVEMGGMKPWRTEQGREWYDQVSALRDQNEAAREGSPDQ